MNQDARKIHFNSLPTAVRRRLVDALAGRAEPRPIASFAEGTGGPTIGWALLGLLGIAGLGALAATDFGSVYSFAQPLVFALGYALGFFLVVYGVLASLRARARGRALPFVPGRYLLPLDLVVARDAEIEFLPTSSMKDVRTVHHHRNGVYVGSVVDVTFGQVRRESFPMRTKEEPQRVFAAIAASHDRIRQALVRGDIGPIRELDVLADVRGAKELDDPSALAAFRSRHEQAGEAPLASTVTPVLGRALPIALVAAVVLGPPTWFLRNLASDEAAFRSLAGAPSSEVEAYLGANGRHEAEARDVVLPAAVFAEAMRSASAASLRAFVTRFPNAPQVGAARQEVHAIYDRAYARFVSAAPPDESLHAFMRALLTFLESSPSANVLVRFFPPSAEALALADAELARRGRREAGHEVVPIAPYFGGEQTATVEQRVTSRLDAGFSNVFSADVFALEHGGRIESSAPDSAHATIDVRYVVRPSGALYVNDRDARAFVGIHLDFDVTMRAPRTEGSYGFALAVEPPDQFSVDTTGGMAASESSIYATMTERAFDHLAENLAAKFFASATSGASAAGK